MFSPALRHRQKVLERQAARTREIPAGKRQTRRAPGEKAPSPSPASDADTDRAALLAVLHENLRTLSDIQSHEARQPKKAEYARQFDAHVNAVLEADEPVQDEILVTMLVWAIDYRDFDRALQLSAFVLEHDLVLPERYSRTPACFLAEEIAELALSQHEQVPHDVLLQVAQQVIGADMPDAVAAKLQKAIGRSWLRKAQDFDPTADNAPAGGASAYAEQAADALKRALTLDAQVGVKKDIQHVDALVKRLAAASQE